MYVPPITPPAASSSAKPGNFGGGSCARAAPCRSAVTSSAIPRLAAVAMQPVWRDAAAIDCARSTAVTSLGLLAAEAREIVGQRFEVLLARHLRSGGHVAVDVGARPR